MYACTGTSHGYHVKSKTWLFSTHANPCKLTCPHKLKSAKNWQSQQRLTQKRKSNELKNLLEINVYRSTQHIPKKVKPQRFMLWPHEFKHKHAYGSINKVPFGKTLPQPEWPLPTSCCNSLCDANWRCWIPHEIDMHRFQTSLWANSQSKEMLQRISNAFQSVFPHHWPVLSDIVQLLHHNWGRNVL